jgi:hypothetical protein
MSKMCSLPYKETTYQVFLQGVSILTVKNYQYQRATAYPTAAELEIITLCYVPVQSKNKSK